MTHSGMGEGYYTLEQLNTFVGRVLDAQPDLCGVWVLAETSDVRVTGGHCYMELIEKSAETGLTTARMRATIWASRFYAINAEFRRVTGAPLASGIKVLVRGNVSFHNVYGLSFNITDIDPQYTIGDMVIRRREILRRLEAEGVLTLNRELEPPTVPQRIAVISARGAAGFGDFVNQLLRNSHGLRFQPRLFAATMQGDNTVPSVLSALEEIAEHQDEYDIVVIIRGGGATSELASFDDYDLAFHVANFPLPVLVGIGHDRDSTVLDAVAYAHVKTPTDAAQWFIMRALEALDNLRTIGTDILHTVREILSANREQLAYADAHLRTRPVAICRANGARLESMSQYIGAVASKQIDAQKTELRHHTSTLRSAAAAAIKRHDARLESAERLLKALSPEAVLRRGYSITFDSNGRAVTDASQVTSGQTIKTRLSKGEIVSTINK